MDAMMQTTMFTTFLDIKALGLPSGLSEKHFQKSSRCMIDAGDWRHVRYVLRTLHLQYMLKRMAHCADGR